jgi:hypothetical protein
MKKQASPNGDAIASHGTAAVTGEASPSGRPNGLLSGLGLHGLAHLDAPALAALAVEAPLLLIGPHGSAKSALRPFRCHRLLVGRSARA